MTISKTTASPSAHSKEATIDQCYFHSEKNSISILIPFFPIISFQFLISISRKILILILIPFFDCNSYFNS